MPAYAGIFFLYHKKMEIHNQAEKNKEIKFLYIFYFFTKIHNFDFQNPNLQ